MKIFSIIVWILWSFLCLVTFPFYILTYPIVWLVSGFKNVPWWWTAGDWIEERLPG